MIIAGKMPAPRDVEAKSFSQNLPPKDPTSGTINNQPEMHPLICIATI